VVIISSHAVLGSSPRRQFSVTIVLIIGHFLTSVKFHKILQQYQNSAENGKFRSSARNYAAHGKLWALLMYLVSAHMVKISAVQRGVHMDNG